jgi:hypothetical protein
MGFQTFEKRGRMSQTENVPDSIKRYQALAYRRTGFTEIFTEITSQKVTILGCHGSLKVFIKRTSEASHERTLISYAGTGAEYPDDFH